MPAVETATHTEDAPALVADSVSALQNTLSVGRREVERADGKMLAELKEAIRNGTFKVNVDELAERLVADAFPDGDGG
jgi:anti-sigma28 factor (negative regulator of flagellin synthesis)